MGTDDRHKYITSTLERDPSFDEKDFNFRQDDLENIWNWLRPGDTYDSSLAKRIAAAQIEFYRRLRPGEPPSLENSRNLIQSLFFDHRRYDLGRVGRYKLNRRLSKTEDSDLRVLT